MPFTSRVARCLMSAWILLLALFATSLGHRTTAEQPTSGKAEPLRILVVGNSFTANATRFFPEIVAASPHDSLILGKAIVGGGPLEQHWNAVAAHEADPADPKGRIYGGQSLKQRLREGTWDFVTIQQNSYKSTDVSTYRPYAGNLCRYLREHAPGAEIIIHQTWAYRADDPRFDGDYSQADMYRDLTQAYRTIAQENGVERIIPAGRAFQMARSDPAWRFTFPDPDFDYEDPVFPAMPRQVHSLNRGWQWDRNKMFRLDGHHANAAGEYLAAAVWYEFFYGSDVRGNPFLPEELPPEDVAFLQRVAHRTVTSGGLPVREQEHAAPPGGN